MREERIVGGVALQPQPRLHQRRGLGGGGGEMVVGAVARAPPAGGGPGAEPEHGREAAADREHQQQGPERAEGGGLRDVQEQEVGQHDAHDGDVHQRELPEELRVRGCERDREPIVELEEVVEEGLGTSAEAEEVEVGGRECLRRAAGVGGARLRDNDAGAVQSPGGEGHPEEPARGGRGGRGRRPRLVARVAHKELSEVRRGALHQRLVWGLEEGRRRCGRAGGAQVPHPSVAADAPVRVYEEALESFGGVDGEREGQVQGHGVGRGERQRHDAAVGGEHRGDEAAGVEPRVADGREPHPDVRVVWQWRRPQPRMVGPRRGQRDCEGAGAPHGPAGPRGPGRGAQRDGRGLVARATPRQPHGAAQDVGRERLHNGGGSHARRITGGAAVVGTEGGAPWRGRRRQALGQGMAHEEQRVEGELWDGVGGGLGRGPPDHGPREFQHRPPRARAARLRHDPKARGLEPVPAAGVRPRGRLRRGRQRHVDRHPGDVRRRQQVLDHRGDHVGGGGAGGGLQQEGGMGPRRGVRGVEDLDLELDHRRLEDTWRREGDRVAGLRLGVDDPRHVERRGRNGVREAVPQQPRGRVHDAQRPEHHVRPVVRGDQPPRRRDGRDVHPDGRACDPIHRLHSYLRDVRGQQEPRCIHLHGWTSDPRGCARGVPLQVQGRPPWRLQRPQVLDGLAGSPDDRTQRERPSVGAVSDSAQSDVCGRRRRHDHHREGRRRVRRHAHPLVRTARAPQ